MPDKVVNLKEASKSNYIQITPEEALEKAKSEPGLKKVLIIMVSEEEEMSWYQGGGMAVMEQLWYMERVKANLIGPV